MILVDSNVFIDYWKNPGEAATKTFMYEEAAKLFIELKSRGVVKPELMLF